MQKKTIEHPFHKVFYDYDETKTWTPRDEKLLKTYMNLIDHENQRHEKAKSLRTQFLEFNKKVEAMRKALRRVQKKITATCDAADHVIAQVNLQVPKAAEKFAAKVNKTNDEIQAYDRDIRVIEKEIKALSKLKNQYIDQEEDSSFWERLSELKITYAHDSRLSTDYVSFDREEERFRDKASYMARQNDIYIDRCEQVLDNYNRLLLETTTQYEVWKEFGKRLRLIEHITGDNAGMGQIGLN